MRTKEMIRDAAFVLFRENKFEKITVNMICDKAGVSKGSFYNYYKDKYELLFLFAGNYLNKLFNEVYDGHNWRDVLIQWGNFVLGNRVYFKNAEDGRNNDSLDSYLQGVFIDFYSRNYLKNANRDELSDEESLKIKAVSQAVNTIFEEFLYKRANLSPDQLADLCCELIPTSYYQYDNF